jgi:hypothetical protein
LIILLLALLARPAALAAQAAADAPQGGFGLALSASSHAWRDRVLNPARHAGWFPSLDVYRARGGDGSASRLQLGLGFSPLKSRFDPSTASFAAALGLDYRRERRLARPTSDLQVALGGQLGASFDFAYFDSWDDSHFYWLTSYSLGFAGSVARALSGQRAISLEWNVPVIAVVSRPQALILYKVQEPTLGAVVSRLHRGLRLTSLHEHRAADLTLRLSRPRARVASSVFWRIEYAENEVPHSREVQILRHSFGVTFGR